MPLTIDHRARACGGLQLHGRRLAASVLRGQRAERPALAVVIGEEQTGVAALACDVARAVAVAGLGASAVADKGDDHAARGATARRLSAQLAVDGNARAHCWRDSLDRRRQYRVDLRERRVAAPVGLDLGIEHRRAALLDVQMDDVRCSLVLRGEEVNAARIQGDQISPSRSAIVARLHSDIERKAIRRTAAICVIAPLSERNDLLAIR